MRGGACGSRLAGDAAPRALDDFLQPQLQAGVRLVAQPLACQLIGEGQVAALHPEYGQLVIDGGIRWRNAQGPLRRRDGGIEIALLTRIVGLREQREVEE